VSAGRDNAPRFVSIEDKGLDTLSLWTSLKQAEAMAYNRSKSGIGEINGR